MPPFQNSIRQSLNFHGHRNLRGPLRAKPPAGGGKAGGGTTGAGGAAGGGDGDGDDDEGNDLDAKIDAKLDAKLNAAISSHVKRLEKSLGETISKALETKKPEGDGQQQGQQGQQGNGQQQGQQGQQGNAAKADPALLELKAQVEKLTKANAESEAARQKAEQRAARDATHTKLREQLDGLGIKGARARAVIADLEASGSLKLNEESGAYEIVVKRARSKGGRAEELVFDDLGAGLKDWAQTDDAKEFLPPPSTTTQSGGRRPGTTGAGATTAARATPQNSGPRRELSEREAAEQTAHALEKAGVDLGSLLD